MSIWNTLFTVANIGVTAANYSQLQELKEQQNQSQIGAVLIQMARDMLFNFKQGADTVLSHESVNPKLAAAKLQMLNLGLEDIGITPQLFPDLSDKEYAASTIKHITSNQQRLESLLSPEEREEIEITIQAVQIHQDAEYVFNHYEAVEEYRQAKVVFDELAGRNGCLATIGLILLFYPGILLPGVIFFESQAAGILVFLIWLSIVVVALRFRSRKRYKEAKKTVEALDEMEVDLERFEWLEEQLGVEDKKDIESRLAFANDRIEQFFGTPLANVLPG